MSIDGLPVARTLTLDNQAQYIQYVFVLFCTKSTCPDAPGSSPVTRCRQGTFGDGQSS